MLTHETIVLSCGTNDINNDIFADVRNHAVVFGTGEENAESFIKSLEPFEDGAMKQMEEGGYFKEKGIDPYKYEVRNSAGKTKWMIQGTSAPKGWEYTGQKKWKKSLITGAYKSAKSQIAQAMKEGVVISNEMSRQDIDRARKEKKGNATKEKEDVFVTCTRYAEFIVKNWDELTSSERHSVSKILCEKATHLED